MKVAVVGSGISGLGAAWLAGMDRNRELLLPVFARTYGDDSERRFARWRMFFMACSELFRYRDGQEWWVSHYLLRPQGPKGNQGIAGNTPA
jgi:hypothetical protein